MTKAEFFKMRDKQRARGELLDNKPVVVIENKLTVEKESRILKALGNQKSGVYRTRDLDLTDLLTVEVYTGQFVKVTRRRVDELDNVTVWRI